MRKSSVDGKGFERILVAICVSALLLGCNGTATTPNATSTAPQSTMPSDTPTPIAPPANPSSNTESLPIQGLWLMKSASLAGKEMPKAVTDAISLEITGTNYLVKVGQGIDKGTSEVDTTATPNRMKIVGTEGPNAGKTLLAVVEFPNKDEMKICYDLSGKDYPTSFDSTSENGYYLVTYVRELK